MKTFKIKQPLKMQRDEENRITNDGAFCFICREQSLLDRVKKAYGRKEGDYCLKVFHYPLQGNINKFVWGKAFAPKPTKSTLREATIAQNLMWAEGLAPRVYALVAIEYQGTEYPAQLLDYVVGEEEEDKDKIKALNDKIAGKLEKLGLRRMWGDILPNNVTDGKWLDFQGAKLTKDYVEGLKERFIEKGGFGNAKPYQNCPELGIKGDRKKEARIKDLGLDKVDFRGKSVLDIGSSGGMICNYAADRGAKKIIGIDFKDQIEAARELSNYLGNFNIDYHVFNLVEDLTKLIKGKFDYVFFLAMTKHVGYPDYVNKLSKTLFLEYNEPEKRDEPTLEQVENKMADCFTSYERIGTASDYTGRPIFKAKL